MQFSSLISLAILASSTLAAPSGKCSSALYFMTNDASCNSVIAVATEKSGALGKGVQVETGGVGAAGMTAKGPAGPDALFSQSAVTVGDNYLLAVNAGSNTLSLFNINPENPLDIKLAGKPGSTLGQFPQSVAYSSKLKQACVVNGGKIDGITCYSVSPQGLKTLDTEPRPLNLNQTTPAMGPPGTASHIFFNPDSSALMVTVKGNTAVDANNTGFLGVYPVSNGKVSTEVVKSMPPGTSVLFGTAFMDASTAVTADPSLGATVLKFGPQFTTTGNKNAAISGQSATCWSTASPHGSAFTFDAGKNRVVEINPKSATVAQVLDLKNNNTGLFDAAVRGNFVYALTPKNGSASITAVDISGGIGKMKELGEFIVHGFSGMGFNTQGLAGYPAAKALLN